MESSSWSLLIYLTILVLGLLYFLWIINSVTDLYITHKQRKNFKQALENALKHNPCLTWEQVKVIADVRNLSQYSIGRCIDILIDEALAGKSNEIDVSKLEQFKSNFRQDEPFEGIPHELKLPLEKIRKEITNGQELLEPLVGHLKEFSEENTKARKKQNIYGLIGVVVGIASLTYAFFS